MTHRWIDERTVRLTLRFGWKRLRSVVLPMLIVGILGTFLADAGAHCHEEICMSIVEEVFCFVGNRRKTLYPHVFLLAVGMKFFSLVFFCSFFC